MNNSNAQESIDTCTAELQRIFHLIEGHGHMSPIVPFLTNYAIVRACGTIEFSFKTIISDLHAGHSPQVQNYVDNTIRNSSMNPSRDNICRTLRRFDEEWNTLFKQKLNSHENSERLKNSIDSLNNARNTFAHGDSPSSSFENIRDYFNDCVTIMDILDEVVND
ncbi:HEPN domain-containing protein [Arenibacter palladensis]|uniref:HEPN domain-containing protein n=1 Tax=Arenibacter palladensis TaxID=237373 RepID=UPI0026E460FB|nr:HEPN domain-containing protein [Arenibacter palladensis]MDO6601188.1 HEPN domain-containing protein [Arenibacter palladensis]